MMMISNGRRFRKGVFFLNFLLLLQTVYSYMCSFSFREYTTSSRKSPFCQFPPTYNRRTRNNNNNEKVLHVTISAAALDDSNNIISSSSNNSNKKEKWNAEEDTHFLQRKTDQLLEMTGEGYNNDPEDYTMSQQQQQHTNGRMPGGGGGGKKLRVNIRTFNWLIDSWRMNPNGLGATNAELLLLRLEEIHEREQSMNGNKAFEPDVRIFTKVINTMARSDSPGAAQRSEQMLRRMQNLYESGRNKAAKPNALTYTAVIEGYANSRLGEVAANRANDLFTELEDLYYSTRDPDLRPLQRTYHELILAWSRSGVEGAADHTEGILNHMEEQYDIDLIKMEGAKPVAANYNAVIDAHAKSGAKGATEKAERILNRMESRSKEFGDDPDVRPNVRTYNSLLNAYAKSGEQDSPYKAEEILTHMVKLYESTGNHEVQPDVTSFSTVINAWARSHNFGKAEHALKILEQMVDLYSAGENVNAQPNVIIFNSVMNACAFTIGSEYEQGRALEIAHSMFKSLESSHYMNPDDITYGTYLKVCANQVVDDNFRDSLTAAIFKKCVKDGQVGDLVMQQMQNAASRDLYIELFGSDQPLTPEEIPDHWKCNVREKTTLE